jgi:deoxyribose-phosphate aldolase
MFLTKGATLPDLVLMRKHSAPTVQIKAAGGIRNLKDMLAAIEVGATRIGATATIAIIEEFLGNTNSVSSISKGAY